MTDINETQQQQDADKVIDKVTETANQPTPEQIRNQRIAALEKAHGKPMTDIMLDAVEHIFGKPA